MKNFEMLGELVETADGSLTIRHPEHSETYHSSAGAETEAQELYIRASGLVEELSKPSLIRILDVGLGLSYNAMATFDAWIESPGLCSLQLVSLENNDDLVHALISGAAGWAQTWSVQRQGLVGALSWVNEGSEKVLEAEIQHPRSSQTFHWRICLGDAHETIRSQTDVFRFVWQDPFSPEKNPQMWNADWFTQLRAVCDGRTILMSYSVARIVKDALKESGWDFERINTPVRHKKHWLRAKLGD